MNHVVKNIKKALIWALPAVSLVVLSNTFFPFITGKAFLFRIAVELIFFLYIALAVSDEAYRPRWTLLSVAFAAFTGIMLVADIFAVNPSKALLSNFERMDGFVTLAHLFAYFIVAESVLRDKRDWRIWKLSAVAISVYMMFFCFLQLSGEATINQGGVRVDGSLGNAAYLGTYLVFQFFFLVYLWLSDRISFKEISLPIIVGGFGYSIYYLFRISQEGAAHTNYGLIILAVAFIIALAALILRFSSGFISKFGTVAAQISYSIISISYLYVLYHTATRGAILGLIGGVLVGALYLVFKEKENKQVRKASAGVLIAICVIVGGFYLVRNESFVKNSPVLSRFASLSLDTKGQARNYVWPMAIKGFTERPVLGWGQEGFSYVFQKYYVPEMITHEPFFDRAHNSFLDWLVAGGALGFLAYISLYLIALVFIWRSTVFKNMEKAALFALILAYAFQNMFIFDNLLSYILFVSFLALVSALHAHPKVLDHIQRRSDDGKTALLMSCIVGFVVVALLVNLKGFMQNITLIKAITPQKEGPTENLALFKKAIAYNSFGTTEAREQLSRIAFQVILAKSVPDQLKIDFAKEAVDELEKQIKETNEKDVRSFLGLADFLVRIGAFDQAIPRLEQALTLSPKKQQITFTLAQAYLRKADQATDAKEKKDDIDTAIALMKGVYEVYPNVDAMRLPYITTFIMAGRVGDAISIIEDVEEASSLVDADIIKSLVDGGHVATAEAVLEKAIAQNSHNADAYLMLSSVYVSTKDKAKALATLNNLKSVAPEYTTEADKNIEAVEAYFK